MHVIRWLGQNSKQNKLSRQLGDVQIRMRLKVSGDKSEIRQAYIPALYPHIVKPLMDVGTVSKSSPFSKDGIPDYETFRAPLKKSLSVWTIITCQKKIGTPLSNLVLTRRKMN